MTIREQEDLIRRRDRECVFVWNNEGLLVLEKEGERNKVEFNDEEVALMNGATLTHNHPYGLSFPEDDPRSLGHSFSEDDIHLACLARLAEIRVVTPRLRFSMKPPFSGWDFTVWQNKILPAFVKHQSKVWHDLDQAFLSGTITPAEATVRVLHETWSQVASEVGLVYIRKED